MTLNGLFQDWKDISYEKKIQALKAVTAHLEQKYNKDEDLIFSMLQPCLDVEQDDYFGTEGLRI